MEPLLVQLKLIRHLETLTKHPHRSIVTIGNFDGVHCGHQEVLYQLKLHANVLKLPVWIIIFEPQPKEYFSSYTAPPRLSSLREKIVALKRYGADHVACLKFNAQLANLTAMEFVQKILVDYLNVAYVMVGEDFRFGKDRAGDIHLLRKLGEGYCFQVLTIDTLYQDHQRVSSTRIRQALTEHDFGLAARLLGRPYTVCGRVMHGAERGRLLGFPTANIFLGKRILPIAGVYAVRVHGLTDQALPGVANAGTRPTVDGVHRSLEVHLFDFDQDIYGLNIEIEFVQFVRSELRFDGLQSLKEQIAKDVEKAKEILIK